MVIDFHNHIGLSEDGACGRLDILLENMKKYEIVKTVLFATDEKDKGKTFEPLNTKIIETQKAHPDEIFAFARIAPCDLQFSLNELKRCCRMGVHGLKLKAEDGYDVKVITAILEFVSQKKKFPVIIHTAHQPQNSPKSWEKFFSMFPSVQFVLAHGGKDLYKLCGEIVHQHKNVFVDTTTLSFNRTRHLLEVLGPEKIIFASDYPYSHPAIELKKFEVLVNDQAALKMITYENAANLLGL